MDRGESETAAVTLVSQYEKSPRNNNLSFSVGGKRRAQVGEFLAVNSNDEEMYSLCLLV